MVISIENAEATAGYVIYDQADAANAGGRYAFKSFVPLYADSKCQFEAGSNRERLCWQIKPDHDEALRKLHLKTVWEQLDKMKRTGETDGMGKPETRRPARHGGYSPSYTTV